MASGSGKYVYSSTTNGSGVDLALLTGPGFSVKVTNLNGAGPLYFTVDSPGGACPVPSTGGAATYTAASIAGTSVTVRAVDALYGAVVQLTSSASVNYQVEMQSVRSTS